MFLILETGTNAIYEMVVNKHGGHVERYIEIALDYYSEVNNVLRVC